MRMKDQSRRIQRAFYGKYRPDVLHDERLASMTGDALEDAGFVRDVFTGRIPSHEPIEHESVGSAGDDERITLAEIGAAIENETALALGLSRERVRSIQDCALRKLRSNRILRELWTGEVVRRAIAAEEAKQ